MLVSSTNPEIVISELTFNVDTSQLIIGAWLVQIDDEQTLVNVLDEISTKTSDAITNTDTLAKVKVIAADVAMASITAYESDQTNPAPTLSNYRLLGVTSYYNGSADVPFDSGNLAAINELVAEKATDFTGNALQTLLDTSANAARLDALTKIAAYAENDANSSAPSVDDYTAIGLSVSEFDLSATNVLIAGKVGVDVDTRSEVQTLLRRVDLLGIDVNNDGDYEDAYETVVSGVVDASSQNDSSVSFYLDVSDADIGDVIELWADGELVATSDGLTEQQINNGEVEFTDTTGTSEFDMSFHDGDADESVTIEVKVKQGDVYVQDSPDVTWDFNW